MPDAIAVRIQLALSILRACACSGAGGERDCALGRRGMAAGQGQEGAQPATWPLLSGYARGGTPNVLAVM